MDMKEKLVKLLKRTEYQFTTTHSLTIENVADDLIAHGVIVPPCKVGDAVYRKEVLTFQKETVIVIGLDDEGIYIGTTCGTYREHHFGKTVFLTREEAEAALKEGENEKRAY